MRTRKAEQAIAQKLEENGELRGQLESRTAQSKEDQRALDTARLEQAARSKELGAITERCAQLEKAKQLKATQEQEQQLLLRQLKDSLSAHSEELESRLATRERELLERAATIASLESAAAASELSIQTHAERSAELERELQRLVEQGQAQPAADPAQHAALTARIGELEILLTSLGHQLHEGAAKIESSIAERDVRESAMQALTRRCGELESELQRVTQEAQDRVRRERESQSALDARAGDLEGTLSGREQQLQQRDDTIARLQGEVAAREAQMGALSLRCDEFEAELRRSVEQAQERLRHEQSVAGALSIRADELEQCIASRDRELRESAATRDRLHVELADHRHRLEALGARCSELEQELQRASVEHEESLRHERGVAEALYARADEREQHLSTRDEELRERSATGERLQAELADRQHQLEALVARCSELELELQGANAAHQLYLRQEQVTWKALSVRVVELEDHVAGRTHEPRLEAAEIERLQAESSTKSAALESLERRLGELERELEAQRDHAEELRRFDDELQTVLSARASDLEVRVASGMEELYKEIEAARALESAVDATSQQLETARRRNAELEQELRRRALQQADQEAAIAARADQLDAELASRNEQIRGLSLECAQLVGRCNAVSTLVEQRMRELEERDRQIADCSVSMEALEFAALACHDKLQAEEALIDEFAGTRMAALFQERGLQRSKSLPTPYVDALRQGDLGLALAGLFGDAQPLSAVAVEQLGARWRAARETWKQAPLQREVAYLWTAGVHLEAGLERESDALLVVVAACVDGSRSVLAVETGERDSKAAWLAILSELSGRGMNAPRIVVGDARLGVWSAMDELGWDCARQHCWSSMTAAVLAALPRERRSQASTMLQSIAEAGSRTVAKQMRDKFVKRCGVRLASVGELVTANWKPLTSLYAFPKEHWPALRTADAIEAPLIALRLRSTKPKATKAAADVAAVLWKLLSCAVETWPPLDPLEMVPSLLASERRVENPVVLETPGRCERRHSTDHLRGALLSKSSQPRSNRPNVEE